MSPEEVTEQGVASHERFVQESREIELAWMNGTLDQWLLRKLENERNRTIDRA